MLRRALLAGLICATGVAAQHLRLGLVGGAGLTPDYIRTYFPGGQIVLPDGTVLTFSEVVRQPAGRTAIGGPLLEWSFHSNLSIEGNAIYRRLRLAGVGPTVTWQFPILLKYRFPPGQFGLFVEGGPSLRTTGNRNTNPSHIGVSAGAGLDWQAGAVRLSPTLRYTRWARDVAWTVPSKPDQLELLLAITGDAPSDRHPLGRRVRLGAAGGFFLVRPNRRSAWESPGTPASSFSAESLRGWIVGPRFEFDFTSAFGLLTEANYRQLRFRQTYRFGEAVQPPVISFEGKGAVLWQFPLLLRSGFGRGPFRPFVDVGPSFRLPQDVGGNAATIGVSAGAGVRHVWRGLGFESGLRYSHWGPSRFRNGEIAPNYFRRNQLDLVFAWTF